MDIILHLDVVCIRNILFTDRFGYILSGWHCCDNINLDKSIRFVKIICGYKNKQIILRSGALVVVDNHSMDEDVLSYFGRHGCNCVLLQVVKVMYSGLNRTKELKAKLIHFIKTYLV